MKSPMNRALLAALAFGLASGPVSAQINLSPDTGTAFASYKYAKETVPSTGSTTKNGNTYYPVISEGGEGLNLSFKSTQINSSDTGLIQVTMTGMAFMATATITNWSLASGGKKGDSTALFRYSGTENISLDASITLDVGDSGSNAVLGVTSAHKGSVTVEVINVTLENTLGSGKARKKHTRDVLVGVSAVKATVMPNDLEAKVASGFKGFNDTGSLKTGSLGSIHVALAAGPPKNAATGADAALTDVYSAATVKIKGELSFLSAMRAVALDTNGACPTTGGTALTTVADDKQSVTTPVASFSGDATNHFCITVKDDTEIPAGPYMVDIDYTPVTSSRLSPIADVADAPLGNIKRDGTTIHIPFVTTHQKYTHRFMIVNNGAPTTYAFTFTPESGTTAEAGTMASGDLPKGMTPLKAADIVSLTGGNRTAATFTAVARSSTIEMSSVLVTKDTGATDLTVLMPEK